MSDRKMTPQEQEGFIPELERELDPADFMAFCEDDECPFCGGRLDSKQVLPNCDDQEVFCPECGYVRGIE